MESLTEQVRVLQLPPPAPASPPPPAPLADSQGGGSGSGGYVSFFAGVASPAPDGLISRVKNSKFCITHMRIRSWHRLGLKPRLMNSHAHMHAHT